MVYFKYTKVNQIMQILHKLNKWANSHTNILFDVIRIAFGVFLFIKGIQFSTYTDELVAIVAPNMSMMGSIFIVHYVAMAHLTGGLFIVLGMLTRLTIIIQIPILIGAFLINFSGEMVLENLFQAIIALLLAIFFTIYGSGRHSVDYNLKLNM